MGITFKADIAFFFNFRMHWWGKDEETFCRLFPRYIQQSDITESLYDSGTFFVIIQQCKNKMCCTLGDVILLSLQNVRGNIE